MENIRFFLIDQLGMVVGIEAEEKNGEITIKTPLLIAPSQSNSGSFAMATNPFFEDHLIVNTKYIVGRSEPKSSVISEYNNYLTKKKTGIITPSKPELIK